ncbi:hypothetical protein CHS0354_001540 [Potamilus streckersoni]|uniref:tRNA-splicing endonuclease subunit Sen15 domain-containing protein n=1 Tax=Potamilus streckersoni TaxID=2493646 RepID=A0AAE0SN29_9BIVA|nr:hypothetical protein CHS0354_001540 [Potamilus streckersoni]
MSEKESLHCHFLSAELNEYGIDNPTQMDLTILVYLNLCEVRGWWNVKTHGCHEMNIFFLSGQSSKSSPREIILPISSTSSLSPADIQQYLQIIKVDNSPTKGLILAVCDTDSTMVFYKVTDGLVPPESPEESEQKKEKQSKKIKMRRNHLSHQTQLYLETNWKQNEKQSG